jgi:hypothetical protein
MAGEDLFDQRRTRARHADDEDRVARVAPLPARCAEEVRRCTSRMALRTRAVLSRASYGISATRCALPRR